MLVGKWFGFGRDEIFEEALRAHERGDHETAIEALDILLALQPEPQLETLAKFYLAESCIQLGRAYADAKQPEVALPLVERAIQLSPDYPDFHLMAAMLYRQIGLESAEAYEVHAALDLHPEFRAAVLYDVARRYRNGDQAGAMRRLDAALTQDPGLYCERLCYARQAHDRGDSSRALANLEALAERPDSDVTLHVRLGDSFSKRHLFPEAASEYAKALALAPHYADVLCRHSRALMGMGHTLDAVRQLQAALRLNPNYTEAQLYLEMAMRGLNMVGEADLMRAMRLNKGYDFRDDIDRRAG